MIKYISMSSAKWKVSEEKKQQDGILGDPAELLLFRCWSVNNLNKRWQELVIDVFCLAFQQ